MTPELVVILHVGHGHVPLQVYLARVLLHLLVFAVAGILVWASLRLVMLVTARRDRDVEVEVADR